MTYDAQWLVDEFKAGRITKEEFEQKIRNVMDQQDWDLKFPPKKEPGKQKNDEDDTCESVSNG